MSSQSPTVLFDLPISTGGNVVGTQPAPKVYLLTFTSPPDNRLTTAFCQAMILALDIISTKYEPGVVITTSGIGKFYSNGLDLQHANSTPGFWNDSLYALWRKLLIALRQHGATRDAMPDTLCNTSSRNELEKADIVDDCSYPMPTIALVNGHAFAGAVMLIMMHDYRIMNPAKGFICLNELDLGAPLRPAMTSVFREKCNKALYQKLILLAHRFNAKEALETGLVTRLGGLDEALALTSELALVKRGAPGLSGKSTYWILKREMWRDTVAYLEGAGDEAARDAALQTSRQNDHEEALRRVEQWQTLKSKL
ncbi:ClpP/crotonase [Polychaeton citri CBS 116435]|uniref:ClpP/crotonase n=1 Tax=Polychaeton citri CBS 116435 TaxID=1314669 RepID=A0A9P4Q5Z0_9PEZI|nr:ClpP/crotonase [Polychaeton citri CBS 116435]